MGTSEEEEERKRKRLEAWRKRTQQQQPAAVKVSMKLGGGDVKKKPAKKKRAIVTKPLVLNPFGGGDSDEEDDNKMDTTSERSSNPNLVDPKIGKKRPASSFADDVDESSKTEKEEEQQQIKPPKKRSKRWDRAASSNKEKKEKSRGGGRVVVEKDALDSFMEKLEAGAVNQVEAADISIDVSGSVLRKTMMMNAKHNINTSASSTPLVSGGVITAEQLQMGLTTTSTAHSSSNTDSKDHQQPSHHYYQPADWLSDSATDNEEEEEQGRRALIEALKQTGPSASVEEESSALLRPAQLKTEVKSEKSRREQRLKELEMAATKARQAASRQSDLGRMDMEESGSVMEEAERNLEAAKAAPDALTVLAELNKKKELGAVDHSAMDYLPFQKNLYRVPRALAALTNDAVVDRRAKLKVRVRGHGAPAPVSTFAETGLSETLLQTLEAHHIHQPFPVQAQCIPCILAGRDVIGIAKTGSGKTLAYALPMLRHIAVQPALEPNESGPIGLILAPARELAFQIHSVCKTYAKPLGLKSTAVYGGAGVAEQIGDLKRGTHIVTATPGRLIDILTMQSGKILSLQRVTFVVMDEADRMFDMGFAPQISAILAAVRPDRQTVLFSATFPKAIETLARKSLKYPVEVVVGGRSVASDNVTQHAELVEEHDKFLRLLQILGEQVEGTKKVIVFVDTQVRADGLFEQLLRSGYSTLSLHGGKEQEDRDSTISDFKRKDGPNVLVATGVAGRGLDVGACSCVINFSTPNHLEAYVHQTGRTGRAGNRGVAYTFVNSTDEAKFAPIIVRALSEAGQSENIDASLKKLSDDFKAKVEKGEAKYAGSGFKGKGFTYDSNEMNEAQRMAKLEKRQALIEAGLLDPDEEDPLLAEVSGATAGRTSDSNTTTDTTTKGQSESNKKNGTDKATVEIPENLTPELLALPGMKEALLRKAGIVPATSAEAKAQESDPSLGHPVQAGENHWIQEFEINDYPREARWKVTQKDTTSRMQDEFRTAITLKGSYVPPGKEAGPGERKIYLQMEATSDTTLRNAVLEIQRLLNEETLRVGARATGGGGGSHKYNVLG